MITVVGLGSSSGDMTKAALKAIKGAEVLCVRTLLTKASRGLKRYNPISMDKHYEGCESFDELNDKISDELLAYADKNIVYCVDGDGFSDSSVMALYKKCSSINFIQGVSEGRLCKPSGAAFCTSATEFLSKSYSMDTDCALSINAVDSPLVASELKLRLYKFYSPQKAIHFVKGGKSTVIELEDLDRQKKYDYSCSIFLAGEENLDKERFCFGDLIRIMMFLTDKNGCEWDKVQTHESIAVNVVEESYELVDAIQRQDVDAIVEEAGDVILQGVFHGDIARRSGEFDVFDIITALCKKLVTRHTHIFGGDDAKNAEAALGFWEKAKEKEKSYSSLKEKLSSLPELFPSTLKTEKVVKKAAKAGISIPKENVIRLLNEAINNLQSEKILLYSAILATLNGVSPEIALNSISTRLIDLLSTNTPPQNIDKINEKL